MGNFRKQNKPKNPSPTEPKNGSMQYGKQSMQPLYQPLTDEAWSQILPQVKAMVAEPTGKKAIKNPSSEPPPDGGSGKLLSILKRMCHLFRAEQKVPQGRDEKPSIDPKVKQSKWEEDAMRKRQIVAIILGAIVCVVSTLPVWFAMMERADRGDKILFVLARLGNPKISHVFYFPLIGVCFASALIYFSFCSNNE